ncbi:hypothetical protein NSK_008146 [Nannochloropsis salina CCMP1776]|uniref:Uncharacterized protein n=1 Tax=Nannochloropsis salina CCMP1776 TaxID=1027361 RepID=A0A4D9CS61_9STRA|nr:hypothetical protein NSK_008146 [Nannochloropsis salina CCMP1776]|eukprot:TFJ80405.1 hypothetical protein NSK_008146 [Nannochloropsis salina CCMP1776]
MPGGASGTSGHASTEGRRRVGWERTTGLKATTTPLTSSTTPVKAIPATPSPSTSSPPYSTVDTPSSSSSPGPSPRPSVIANKLQKPQNAPTVWVEFGALAASLPPEKIINLGMSDKKAYELLGNSLHVGVATELLVWLLGGGGGEAGGRAGGRERGPCRRDREKPGG